MTRPTAIVATTIFEPAFLDGYQADLKSVGRLDETELYVIIDRKTPPSVLAAAHRARNAGFKVHCPTLDQQEEFLRRFAACEGFIPFNTDNRRNIGFLMALDAGCEVLISIDDDNFCLPGSDFVGGHQAVGKPSTDPFVRTSDGWFNICSQLEGWASTEIYPRGFPYAAQQSKRQVSLDWESTPIPVAMNAGLWLDDPDVDAVFRLSRQPKISRFVGPSVILGSDAWSPINTQNTALTREAALTYYYVRMGFPLRGLSIDRFGDILSGYLTQKVVKQLGQGIRVGTPIVDHRRTRHNLFKDLYHELAGIVLIEEFVPWLIEARLQGTSSLEVYAALADEIAASASRFSGFIWDDGGREFLMEMSRLMREWIRIVCCIQGNS